MADTRLQHARRALLVSFLIQGFSFALLVTRVPAVQRQYHLSDAALTGMLATVPVLAGVGSIATGALAKRFGSHQVLRWAQPLLCLGLIPVGLGSHVAQLALALPLFALAAGAVDATQNMLGVGLQRAYGRSIMLGFHGALSVGGIAGALTALAGAHWDLSLVTLFAAAACVTVPGTLSASRWYLQHEEETESGEQDTPRAARLPWRPLLPLCIIIAFAFIADSAVSGWSAKYMEDVLDSSEELSTVPYGAYLAATVIGRSFGDLAVRRWGPLVIVRGGTVLAAGGFALAALAPSPWIGLAGFTVVGFGVCSIIPQTFAAGGRLFADASDVAVARLNSFNYLGVLLGAPLIGGVGEASSFRVSMAVVTVLVLCILLLSRSFTDSSTRQIALPHDVPSEAPVGRAGDRV